MKSRRSIRLKLNAIMMFVSSFTLLMACIALVTGDLRSLKQDMSTELRTIASLIGTNTVDAIVFERAEEAEETLAFLFNQPQILSAIIYSEDGKQIASYIRSDIESEMQPIDARGKPLLFWGDHVDYYHNVIAASDKIGSVYIRSDVSKLRARLIWYARIIAAVLLGSLLIAFVLSARLQKVITDPIIELTDTMRRISADRNFGLRAKRSSDDEIGELVDGFNTMIGEIQTRDSELESHRSNLEQLISKRTMELKSANQQLAQSKERAESAAKRMTYQAYHDALTDLPNRTLLNDRLTIELAHALREQKHLALLFIDLDKFKIINDTLGHAFGDALLVEVAERLNNCIRGDDTVARLGGDEFMILLPNIQQPEDAGRVAEKVVESLARPVFHEGKELQVTTSIGISVYPEDGSNAETLTQNADTAMYRAKNRGRNSYFFYTEDMNSSAENRMSLESELQTALVRDEFKLYLQPKVNPHTGEIIGATTHVRWYHPTRGLINLTDIIAIAEESGLTIPLGEWVLNTAMSYCQAWQDTGHHALPISIGLFEQQLNREYLTPTVERILDQTGVRPELIEFEIPEAVAMKKPRSIAILLRDLREFGASITISEFGTGSSSLRNLRQLPINTLNIGADLIKNLPHDADDTIVASACIALAHNLSLGVTANGVENEEQMKFLAEKGCNAVSGRHFHDPVPAGEFSALLDHEDDLITIDVAS